ncbi:PRMT5 arginine-N-methyltransferase-domain-containing protein [Dimargaris cristalligena]|uniref:Protein arginine N-methyltransferase n=1 Tax=Dimargaris cristalligena TaxID=215637 RepID=A0A4V1J5B4_9FUNG|nr:PRMT5 arginine-N-methyltransferase-domain-containing protein [Dimargaris cristalligena]|eukprot:RKP38469.1 PRMT5 arginine-N-methyltransferase-domain-containing protein [Dimargaris cristalligena]
MQKALAEASETTTTTTTTASEADPSATPSLAPEERDRLFQAPFDVTDLYIRTAESCERLVGLSAAWTHLDAESSAERYLAEKVLEKELSWAAHIGVSAIILPELALHSDRFINYARLICRAIHEFSFLQIWLRVAVGGGGGPSSSSGSDPQKAWKNWTTLKQMCGHSARLQVTLILGADLPNGALLNQWFAEPLKCVVVPTSTFTTNSKGYPVLSKAHQHLVRRLLNFTHYFVIEETAAEGPTGLTGHHQKFLRYLAAENPEMSTLEKFAAGYKDYLQSPLQPLMDHLESATYATFEQDPVKYQQYERAIYEALLDRFPPADCSNTVPAEEARNCVIFVVGAGRGPLVDRSLAAADQARRRVKIYALEKNPNAYVTLQRKQSTTWKERVTVVFGDMRYWQPPERADILVSELLGSFGDNELSPECLDGAQRLLKPEGISIPSSYSSYLAPLSSSKLYNQVAALNGIAHFQTPFVVLFDAVDCLYPPQQVWQFHHPNPTVPSDATALARIDNHHNTRYSVNHFQSTNSALVHGLAGYFDAVLYKNVTLSIHPDSHTPGMFSWFPIYFPLKTPILVPEGAVIETHLWRLTSASKVWYEWCLTTEVATTVTNDDTQEDGQSADSDHTPTKPHTNVFSTTIHNLNGSSYWIGL